CDEVWAKGFQELQLLAVIKTEAAVGDGLVDAEKALAAHLAEKVVRRKAAGGLPLLDVGVDFLVDEALDAAPNALVLLAELHRPFPWPLIGWAFLQFGDKCHRPRKSLGRRRRGVPARLHRRMKPQPCGDGAGPSPASPGLAVRCRRSRMNSSNSARSRAMRRRSRKARNSAASS